LEDQAAVVEQARRVAGSAWDEQGWVFPALGPGRTKGGEVTTPGGMLHPRNVARAFEKARDKAGLRRESFHSLRHFSVSVQLGAHVPLEIVSKRIGHGSRAVTADTYGHLLPEGDQEAAARVDAWIADQDTARQKTADRRKKKAAPRPS
jgi:integrase